MAEDKEIEKLGMELEERKREKARAEHQLQRKQNQLSYRESLNRKERSHRLIVCGAIFEKYFPVIKNLTEPELSKALSFVNISGFTEELIKGIDRVRKE